MKTKPSLDDLALFHTVAQHGSLRAAANRQGIPIATLSRRLQALERILGCRLLERNAHRFSLTEAGQAYLQACGPLLEELQAVTDHLDENQRSLSGSLRVTAPVNLTQQWMGNCFFAFMRRYPGIRLQLLISNHYENLVEQQLDAAVRVGEQEDSSQWIARLIGRTHLALCASPEYLRSAPPLHHPRDLAQHTLIVANPINRWDLTHRDTAETFSLQTQPYFQATDIQLALNAAAQHFGILLVPDYYLPTDHDPNARVQRVLADWVGQPRPIYLVYRDRHAMPARLRAFVDHVVEWMGEEKPM
ncbi:MAG TPA: LysR family transcriptional regulator [Dongiaceae bacterium]|nr:LysR family transcriptional regulator [Dongiaceae bacterium]